MKKENKNKRESGPSKRSFSGRTNSTRSSERQDSRPTRRRSDDSEERSSRPARRSSDSESRAPRKRSESSDDRSGFTKRRTSEFGETRPRRSSEERTERTGFARRKTSEQEERPKRSYGSREKENRFDDKPRAKRSFGSEERGSFLDKKDKPSFERGGRSSTRRPGSDDRPKKPFSKREDKGYSSEDSERSGERRRSFDSDKPFKRPDSRTSRGSSERPERRKREDFFSELEREERTGSKEDTPKRAYSSDKPSSARGRSDRKPDFDSPRRSEGSDYKPRRSFSKGPSSYKPSRRKESSESETGMIRLNRYLANSGISSRREADDLIKSGSVSVNGKIITEMGFKVNPGEDVIQYGGETIKREKKVYILLNKPKDYITTNDDPQNRKTVLSLVANAGKERVYPVGRLDRMTTGVLLLTNDGEMTKKLTHPRYEQKKVYHVVLDKALKSTDLEKIKEGVTLEDGEVKADAVSYVSGSTNKREIGIELHSGKNRIVRRIFEHLGYEVVRLDRVSFAGLTKKDLPRGKWRFLTEKEIGFLKMIQ